MRRFNSDPRLYYAEMIITLRAATDGSGRGGQKPKPFKCSEDLFWYLVGLVATDGCLLRKRKTVYITSKDKSYLRGLRRELGLTSRVASKTNSSGSIGYDLIIQRVVLYEKLRSIGLTPRKSLTIGRLKVPDTGFADFLRGVIDGDGNIHRWRHPTNGREQWAVRIFGCSRPFLCWIGNTIERLWEIKGRLHEEEPGEARFHTKYTLKFGKMAAKAILARCYYPGVFALERKRRLAERCIAVPVGWSKSKTVVDQDNWDNWTYVHVWRDGTMSETEGTYGTPSDISLAGFVHCA